MSEANSMDCRVGPASGGARRYAEITPLLLSMVSRAAHVNRWEPHKIVQEKIDGHEVMCVGKSVIRNGLDGDTLTVMIRWRIDGKPATRKTVYERFGRITTKPNTPINGERSESAA